MSKKQTYDFSGLDKPTDSVEDKPQYDFSGLGEKKNQVGSAGSSTQPSPSPPSGFRTSFEKGEQTSRPLADQWQPSQAEEGGVLRTPLTQQDRLPADQMEFEPPTKFEQTSFDYIMKAGAAGSISANSVLFMSALEEGTKLNKDKPFEYAMGQLQKAHGKIEADIEGYDPNVLEQIGAGAFGLLLDAGPFKLMGSAAKGGVKAAAKAAGFLKRKLIKGGVKKELAEQTAKGVLTKHIATGMAGTGLTLGQYHAASNTMEQLRTIEQLRTVDDVEGFSIGETLKEFGKGALLGAGVGALSATAGLASSKIMNGSIKNGIIRKAAAEGVPVAALPLEGGIFELGSAALEGRPATVEGWIVNTGIVAGAKFAGGVPEKIKRSKSFSPEKRNRGEYEVDFSVEEISQLNKDKAIGQTAEGVIEGLAANPESLSKIMMDPKVAWTTKAKISWAVHGVEPTWSPDVTGVKVKSTPDGRSIAETYDANGFVVERSYYDTKAAAMKDAASVETSLREGVEISRLQNMDVSDFAKVEDGLHAKGMDNGADTPELIEALETHNNKRTPDQRKLVKGFMDVMKGVKEEPPTEPPQKPKEGVSPEKGTEAPLKEEKPSETLKTKPEEVQEKSAEYDKRTLELLNEFEKEGESGNYAEAVANIDVKIAELSKAGKHAEANKLEALLKEVEGNKYFKKQGDVKLEKTQEIREFVEGKVESKEGVSVVLDEATQKIRGEDHFPYDVVENGESIGNVSVNYIEHLNGYVVENVKLNKTGQGVGGEVYKRLSESLDKPIVSDLSQTEAATRMWDKMVESGKAEKFTDIYDQERYRTVKAKTETKEAPAKTKEVKPVVKEDPKVEKPKSDTEAPIAMSVDSKGGTTTLNFTQEKIKAKVAEVRAKYEAKKADTKVQRQILDGFIKANRTQLENNLSAADMRLLNNATTWKQVANVLKKFTKKIEKPTFKQNAASLVDFLNNNKGRFGGVTPRVHEAMLKKAAQASLSQAKLDNAKKYIEDVLNKAEYRKEQDARLKAIEGISAESSIEKTLEKKGLKPKKKKAYLSREGADPIEADMDQINQLVTKGSSKKYKNPAAKLEANEKRLEDIYDKDEVTDNEMREALRLQVENEVLEYANLDNLSLDRVQQKLKDVKDMRAGQRSRVARERAARHEAIVERNKMVLTSIRGAKTIPSEVLGKKRRAPFRVNKLAIYEEMSFNSLLGELARYDKTQAKEPLPLYKDKINKEIAPMVLEATKTHEKHQHEFRIESLGAMGKILGTPVSKSGRPSGEMLRKLVDLSTTKESKVEIFNEDGSSAGFLELSQMSAGEKLLQLRDAGARESLFTPADKGGNGYTEQTVKQLESFTSKEAKELSEFFMENLKKYGDLLDEAYIRENGVSMKNANPEYWPMTKSKRSGKGDKGMQQHTERYPAIRADRTKRRSGDKSALAYTSMYDTYRRYASEAMHYASWAETVRELNYTFRDPVIRENIKQLHGTKAMSTVDNFVKDFSGTLDKTTYEIVDKTMGNIVGGILGLKVRPAIKQAMSTIYYGLEMPSARLAKNTAAMVGGTSPKWRALKELVKEQPFLQMRNSQSIISGADVDASTLSMQEYGANPKRAKVLSKPKEVIDVVRKVGGAPLRMGDKMPIVNGGGAYIDFMYEKYAGKKLTKETIEKARKGEMDPNLDKAIKDWDMLSMLTQQSQRQMNVSMFRKTHSFGRVLTTLTSGPMQIQRLSYNYAREFEKAAARKDRAGMAKYAKKYLVTHAVSGFMFQLAQQNFNLGILRDKSDKDWRRLGVAALLGNLEAIAGLGKGVAWLKAQASDEWWAVDGIQVSPLVNVIDDIAQGVTSLIGELKAPARDTYKTKALATKTGSDISKLLGLPIEGSMKVIEGWQDLAEHVSKEPVADALGIGTVDPSQTKAQQQGYSYSGAVKDMDKFMGWRGEDDLLIDTDGIVEYSKKLKERGIDPVSVIRTAYMDELRTRFNRLYKHPATLKAIDEIYSSKGETISIKDEQKLEALYRKIEEQEGDTGFLDNVLQEIESIIQKVDKETTGRVIEK